MWPMDSIMVMVFYRLQKEMRQSLNNFINRAILLITNWRRKIMFTRHNANSLGELARKATQAAQVHGTDCEIDVDGQTIQIWKNDNVVGEIVLEEQE